MDLATLESQLGQTENRLSAYDANLPSEIESQVKKAGSPLIKESLGVTQDLMGDYLGRYFDTTTMGPGMQGTTAKDLAPTQKLGVMGRELGTMSGQLNSAQQYTDYLGGQINDLYGKAVQAAQLGQQGLADEYSRLFQRYQMAWQAAEAEKNRALQRALAQQQIDAMNQANQPVEQPLPPEPVIDTGDDRNWTQKVIQAADSNNPITGYDFSSYTPDKKSMLAVGLNPLAAVGSIPKTIGGAVGNLIGNRGNQNMTFLEKLYNIR